MKPYRGGIRHDYKNSLCGEPRSARALWLDARARLLRLQSQRHVSWFAFGLAAPLVAVAVVLLVRHVEPPELPAVPATPAAAASAPDGAGSGDARSAGSPAADTAAAGAAFADAGSGEGRDTAEQAAGTSAPAATLIAAADDGPAAAAADALGGVARQAAAVLDLVVKKGDSLEQLFRRNDLSLADLAAMVQLPNVADYLKLLRPGDSIEIAHEGEHVLGLTRELDDIKLIKITRGDDGYKAKEIERPVDLRETHAHGVIKSSLFDAGSDAGISDALIMAMAGIFQWDIDFIQDVREGDTFKVIYQQQWRDGTKLGDGPLLAAEFVNQGHAYRAVRYTDPTGHSDYYTRDGHSLRKAFIRAPVDFTRISSRFELRRYHPILHRFRAHKGVDYAAPIGTPVHAAGDGKVIFRGRKGGYGNVVILQHGGNITTLYGHLSKFGRYKVGSRVKQGEVIAYVGMTGLATGPHLHYEYRVNGVHRNPRTVPLPPADPVPAQYRADFEKHTETLWSELDALDSAAEITTAAN